MKENNKCKCGCHKEPNPSKFGCTECFDRSHKDTSPILTTRMKGN